MRFSKGIIGFLGAAALYSGLCGAARAGDVTVFAAASLREALDEVAADYTQMSGDTITISYAGSSALARQIERGAPADLFISASADWMDQIEASGHIRQESRVDLLGNRLVLIAPAPGEAIGEITSGTDLAGLLAGGKLAMALTEAVPAGIYGRAALETLGLWDGVADAVAEADNVRAALALVALRAAALGIVYATDAAAEPKVAVIGTFATETHPPIIYPAALTTRASAPEAAAFLDYLRGSAADDVFEAHGFLVTAE
jgi:molybdate transport system substrate-binding protein